MALHTCQIQQYDFNYCEQQFEKLCGKGERTPLKQQLALVCFVVHFLRLSCFQNLYNLLQPTLIDEDMAGGYVISSWCVSS